VSSAFSLIDIEWGQLRNSVREKFDWRPIDTAADAAMPSGTIEDSERNTRRDAGIGDTARRHSDPRRMHLKRRMRQGQQFFRLGLGAGQHRAKTQRIDERTVTNRAKPIVFGEVRVQ
jgi:hypothetical protein